MQSEKLNNNLDENYTENNFEELIHKSRKISHQLNNLLTAIIANIQLLNSINDEEKQPILKSVEDAAINAGEIIFEFQKYIRSLQK